MEEIFNTVEELLRSDDNAIIVHIYKADDLAFNFYRTISGFLGGKYFDLSFIEWGTGNREVHMSHTTEQKGFFQELLEEEGLDVIII